MNTYPIDELVNLFDYNPETGILKRRIFAGPNAKAGDVVGCPNSGGYLRVVISGKYFPVHRVIYAMHHGKWPKLFIDHVNGNVQDNRISNLREATREENNRNNKVYKNNKSGFKGVSWHPRDKKWYANIGVNNKMIYLGSFDSPEDAYSAYCNAANKHHGKFSRVS